MKRNIEKNNKRNFLTFLRSEYREMSMSGRLLLLLATLLLYTGCEKLQAGRQSASEQQQATVKPVEAEMLKPIRRQITDFEEFTGRMLPFDEVDVRAQVGGTLMQCTFKEGETMKISPQTGKPVELPNTSSPSFREGTEVKEGDLLFAIDPDVYKTELSKAEGELVVLEARKKRLENDYRRAKELLPSSAVSEKEYDLAYANLQECIGEIAVAKANIQRARINLNYTKIYAPIDGYLCNSMVSVGNLIQSHLTSNTTSLVRIVKIDPIYIQINIDEATVLRLKRIADELKAKDPNKNVEPTIEFRLSDESEYKHEARIDYTTPTIDQSSGTQLIRAICANPKKASGERFFHPGMTVHVRIRVTEKYDALLVPEHSLGTNQSTRFVYVPNKNGMPEMKVVELGPLQEDNMRVIRKGLNPDDLVIVSNLMRIRLNRPVVQLKK